MKAYERQEKNSSQFDSGERVILIEESALSVTKEK